MATTHTGGDGWRAQADPRFAAAVDAAFPGAVERTAFVAASVARLAPFGFAPGGVLPMVGVCRDELTQGLIADVQERWGLAFDLSSLAGMLFLGRTGLAAAQHHAPSADGRHRYVAYTLAHVGVDADGTIGAHRRPGQAHASATCGALAAFRDELARGVLDVDLDPLDLEQSLLRQRLLRKLRYGEVPDLAQLTRLTLEAIVEDLVALAGELERTPTTDTAVVSGILIHGPGGLDLVAPGRAFVRIGDDHAESLLGG